MFFSPQKECAARGENRLYRKIKKYPSIQPEQRNASLMCFCQVMVANVSHVMYEYMYYESINN